MPRIIVVLPVYNEQRTLLNILTRIDHQADMIVCVNDGSRDRSLSILRKYVRNRRNTFIVDLPSNTGMAGAIKNGFLFVLYLLKMKKVGLEDIVVTIDADGQHKPEYISKIARYMALKKVDVVLTQRDFSLYPFYKVVGNRLLTFSNSILSGFRYKDVESGLRFLKVRTVEPILRFYTGVKYSCAQEIALISARTGFKIDNDYLVTIAYYRKGTTIRDGFIVLALSILTFIRYFIKVSYEVSADQPLFQNSYTSSMDLWRRAKKKKGK